MTKKLTITLDGRKVPFSGTRAEHAAIVKGQRRWRREQARLRTAAYAATGKAKIAAVSEFMLALSSQERIAELVPLIEHEPAKIFWSIFLDEWSSCDGAFGWNHRLAQAMRRVGQCPPDMLPAFYDDLPEQLTLYRGASRACIEAAISWTTAADIAKGFARGHRGIRVPDAVIATATIHKADVFAAVDDRNEWEVLCLPRILKIEAVAS